MAAATTASMSPRNRRSQARATPRAAWLMGGTCAPSCGTTPLSNSYSTEPSARTSRRTAVANAGTAASGDSIGASPASTTRSMGMESTSSVDVRSAPCATPEPCRCVIASAACRNNDSLLFMSSERSAATTVTGVPYAKSETTYGRPSTVVAASSNRTSDGCAMADRRSRRSRSCWAAPSPCSGRCATRTTTRRDVVSPGSMKGSTRVPT